MGLASWRQGDLAAAEAAYAETIRRFELVGYVSDILGCAVTLADLQLTRGALRDAERTYRNALDLAARQPAAPLRGMPDMYVGLSMIHAERGDLTAAAEQLRLSHELGEYLGLPKHPHRWRIAEARLREAEGDLPGALTLIDAAERVYDGDFSPDVQPVAAMRARLWVRQGRPELALAWAADRGLSVSGEPDYLREFELVTLARALLASGDTTAAGLLERLLAQAEAGGRFGSVLEILVLLALARQRHGDVEGAVADVARALELGEPEGYARTFTDEGPAMVTLLGAASARGVAPAYVDRLLSREGPGPQGQPARLGRAGRPAQRTRARRASPPGERAERPRDRPAPGRVPEHRAHAHQEHLRQARRRQPASCGAAGRGARPAPPLAGTWGNHHLVHHMW